MGEEGRGSGPELAVVSVRSYVKESDGRKGLEREKRRRVVKDKCVDRRRSEVASGKCQDGCEKERFIRGGGRAGAQPPTAGRA